MEEELVKESQPIVIEVKNTSDSESKFVIFGFNRFNKESNFGNPEHIKVSSVTGNTYGEYFNNTASEDFVIGKMRFQSSVEKNLQKSIFYHTNNLFMFEYVRKELNLAIMMDAYQLQKGLVDATKKWEITRQTHLSGVIQANSRLVITMFPIQSGRIIPRVSGKKFQETLPVIEQPTDKDGESEITGG